MAETKPGASAPYRLFGVEFRVNDGADPRYCEVVAKSPDGILETLRKAYGDVDSICGIDDQGECDDDGELVQQAARAE